MDKGETPRPRGDDVATRHLLTAFGVVMAGLTLCASVATADCSTVDEGLLECPWPEIRLPYRFIEGLVVVSYTVKRDGSVDDIEVIESKPPGFYDGSAVAALRLWKYQPTDTSTRKQWTFTFRLAE